MSYYTGEKLLSLKDINGNTPEIYICTTNRTGGKTTYFSRYLLNRFINYNEKFGLLFRFQYELDDVAEKFFKDVGSLFFPRYEMRSEKRAKGIHHELFLNDKPCGYALCLNSADQIKKMSHLFSDTSRLFMDEFQSETNKYCDNEIQKFRSIHTSIARGRGKQVRYLPTFLVGNPVSLLNPYYTALGISNRLNTSVKFLKGDGFVLEQGFNYSAAQAQQESGFNRAFSADLQYTAYNAQGVYLNDNLSFIDKPEGRAEYVATIRYQNVDYAIRRYNDSGIMYCDNRPDYTFPTKLSLTTQDHNINYVMLNANKALVYNMRYLFEKGAFRFKDLKSKEVILQLVSY